MRTRLLLAKVLAPALALLGNGVSPEAWGQTNLAAPQAVYATGFEFSEGYDPRYTLIGQNGWVGAGTGGNGIVSNYFPGFGQQAYVGYNPPNQRESFLNVWKPINLASIPTNRPIVKFSVMMQVVDSTNQMFDDFRWSIYNSEGDRLFSLDFDNGSNTINYGLDDGLIVDTRTTFDNVGYYDLEIAMNFARNLWSATLNGAVIVNSKPITTANTKLNFGDADAVWAIRRPGSAGNNFMLFDNYKISAEAVPSMPARIETLGIAAGGQFGLRVFGETGLNYVIEASSDLVTWSPLKVITAPAGGAFDFFDPDTRQSARRFYRAWHRP